MLVPMPDGTMVTIEHLAVVTAKETLGIWSAPNGSADGALSAMTEKARMGRQGKGRDDEEE